MKSVEHVGWRQIAGLSRRASGAVDVVAGRCTRWRGELPLSTRFAVLSRAWLGGDDQNHNNRDFEGRKRQEHACELFGGSLAA
jgi:hypothetical protein